MSDGEVGAMVEAMPDIKAPVSCGPDIRFVQQGRGIHEGMFQTQTQVGDARYLHGTVNAGGVRLEPAYGMWRAQDAKRQQFRIFVADMEFTAGSAVVDKGANKSRRVTACAATYFPTRFRLPFIG